VSDKADCNVPANNKLNVVSYGRYVLVTLTTCLTSHSSHGISLQQGNARKSHNWIVQSEVLYVITIRTAVENVILFALYKIFVGRSKVAR